MRAPVRTLATASRRDSATTPSRRLPARTRLVPAGTADAPWIYPAPAAHPEPRWRDQAVAAVSHDLRNPLNSISLAAELLQRVWPAGAEMDAERKLLESIVANTEKMRRMVMDLLDDANLDAGGIPVATEPVELGGVLRASVEGHALEAQQRGVTLTVIDAVPAPVPADAGRIDQVLGNLIGNALKHTPHGGHVTVTAERTGGEVCVSVTDTGRGIQSADLARIFERHWRSSDDRSHGAGLGLSIAAAIVQAHGGRIWAQSAPGQGTTMTFTLPLA